MSFVEIKQRAENTLKFVQGNPVLDTLTRGAMNSFPAGQILLKFYDKYAEINTEDTVTSISKTFELITKMNEEQFNNFSEILQDNTVEILENQKQLTILTDSTAMILGLILDIKMTQKKEFKEIKENQKIINSTLEEHGKILIEIKNQLIEQNYGTRINPNVKPNKTKEFEDKIAKLEEEKTKLQTKLEKVGEKPKIDVDLLLRESNFYFDKNQFKKTIDFAQLVISIEPENYVAWFNKGLALVELGRFDEGIESYDNVIRIKHDFHEVWNNRGYALTQTKKFNDAMFCLNKAIMINENSFEAWNNKGIVLHGLERYEEAISCYEKAVEIKHDFDNAWYNKGFALYKLDRYNEAINAYDKAIQITPNYAEAWNNKGMASYKLERYEEAISCYEKALSISPNYLQAENNKNFVRKILES